MASRLPMPKLGKTKNRPLGLFLLVLMTIGYICGFLMVYPEAIFWMPTLWCLIFLIWGQASASARAMYPPPLFPRIPQQPLIRPQADLGEIVALDESGNGAPASPPKP
jgi:hypothetical protein